MNKKLIAIDLDGTLLTDNKSISSRNKSAVQKAISLGHQVVIATGRPPRSSVQFHQTLGLTTPMINFNGALIHHRTDPSRDVHFPLEGQTVSNLLRICEDFGVENIMVEVRDTYHVHKIDELITYLGEGHNPQTVGDLQNNVLDHATDILVRCGEQQAPKMFTHIEDLYNGDISQRYWGAPYYVIEWMRAGVSKASGLETLSSQWGIAREDVLVFGDAFNDKEMFEWAGHSVAMGNASDEIKNLASDVTLTNEQDGVANYLEKWLFSQK